MKPVLTILSAAALGLTIVPSCLLYAGSMEAPRAKALMLAGTLLWFAAATALTLLRKSR